MNSLEDNLHGEAIPIKEALILASANKKYPISKLRLRLGEEEATIRDRLLLVNDDEKLKKIADDLNAEHLLELEFIVDLEPKENAERLTKDLARYGELMGAKLAKSTFRRSKKEAVAVLLFNVSESQSGVIENAINKVMKAEQVSRGRSLELITADFLAGLNPVPKKLSPVKKLPKT